MINLNYDYAKNQILKNQTNWKKRYLTPFGQITIVKTFLLSKLNHLLLTLPSPKPKFLNEINTILYRYIWSNKPNKIKHILVVQNYNNGGLKMFDLIKFVRALKITWV